MMENNRASARKSYKLLTTKITHFLMIRFLHVNSLKTLLVPTVTRQASSQSGSEENVERTSKPQQWRARCTSNAWWAGLAVKPPCLWDSSAVRNVKASFWCQWKSVPAFSVPNNGLKQQLRTAHKTLNSFFLACLRLATCGILVPQPGIEPAASAMEAQSPNHRTPGKSPTTPF